jgi:hypothetical protein
MPSRTIRLFVGLTALLLALPAFAGKVYQWKDAKGVTHYSDSPPPAQPGVKNRELKTTGPAPTLAAAEPAESENCATARKNLAQLQGNGPAGFDADGDGKLDKEMSADERGQYVQQTELMLKTYCNKPAAKP